ncbi:ATP-binding protein [Nocardiopsis gilva YIM 90087]|uniref:ATP-binding protein n=1 Tax=Nocardiopsis gilva YIM 90087 TaxID=1235441 RepID=A0A223S2A7_9ACTN|nr:hypothetical protein [Nocardiopsis gilva]ASU82254.1 ATP-binding protein [Nocardiopsis gilva YIM 90087]
MSQTSDDPFGTTELRRRVLDGWADAPARFREDANAEEDYALGGYRDRVIVELAQNAADAARRTGGTGRLLLRLSDHRFIAANTGAPLTAAGVESLATLRASAKRDDAAAGGSTGRFGVGFSAVAAISDDVTVASHEGAVRFDRTDASAEVRALLLEPGRAHPELGEEFERRGEQVPLLRLPFACQSAVPAGYDTAVTLVLRDDEVRDRLRAQLAETSEALLLALPDLAEVRIETGDTERVLTRESGPGADGTGEVLTRVRDRAGEHITRWRTVTRSGRVEPSLLADRPTEERARLDWTLTWAAAVTPDGHVAELPSGVERVVHAPTPSGDELALPALLIGTFPLTPDRRRIAQGPAAEMLTGEAAEAYCDLLCAFEARAALDLVPVTALGRGEFDAGFRSHVAKALPDTPFLRTSEGDPIRPRDAVLLEGGPEVTAVVGALVRTALPGHWNPRHPGLAQLRVRRVGLAELADLLADLDREPSWWARLYAALRAAGRQGADLGDLGALPVPLSDGRLVRGPRSLLVPVGDLFGADQIDPHTLDPLGLRIVHPEAADPLLTRLGAIEANEAAVLTDPQTRAAVENSLEADNPEEIAAAVLELVAASGTTADDAPWLAELALPDDEGGYSVAGELLLPSSPLLDIFTDDAPFGVVSTDTVERHGADALRAVGVLDAFNLVRAEDVTLGAALDHDDLPLDGLEEWAEEVAERTGAADIPPVVPELVGVADLEFVREDRWPQALELLAGPRTRGAIVEPARVLSGDGRAVDVPSYTAWWLRTGAVLGGRCPVELRTRDAAPALTGLYDLAPESLDPAFAREIGVRASLEALMAEPDGPDDLLERLADPQRHVERQALREIWTAIAAVDPDRVSPPERVRAVRGGAIVVADPEETVVVDTPDLLPLLDDRPVVLVPAEQAVAMADVLDIALASEVVPGEVASVGELRPIPEVVALFLDIDMHTYLHHDELRVDGVPVEWRYRGGSLHAATTDGLARALCWAAGRWSSRHLLAAVLRDPAEAPALLAETDLD